MVGVSNQQKRREIRDAMRKILANLDARWLQAASREIADNLSTVIDGHPGSIRNILAWVPHFPGEIDLTHFISRQIEQRAVYLPRITGPRQMEFVRIPGDWSNKIEAGILGMPSPASGLRDQFNIAEIDHTAIIVPGIAFDREGNRLGRGKGFYSTLLKPPMTRALKIGVCWELQLIGEVATDTYNAIMDWVCHERGAVRTAARSAGEDEN